MKFKKHFFVKRPTVYLLFILAIFLFISENLYGQNLERYLISNAGSEVVHSALIIDFSVGETAVNYDIHSSVKISQGFHQGSSLVSSIYTPESPLYNLLVYPNPTIDRIHLENPSGSPLNYKVHDINGRIKMLGEFHEKIQTLNTWVLDEGIYILVITDAWRNSQSYKFIKI